MEIIDFKINVNWVLDQINGKEVNAILMHPSDVANLKLEIGELDWKANPTIDDHTFSIIGKRIFASEDVKKYQIVIF